MNKRLLPFLLILATCMVHARLAATPLMDPAAIKTLARRSGLSEATLHGLLSHCDASQKAMYFCAWRDLLSVDAALDQRVSVTARAGGYSSPLTGTALADWRKQRDRSCATAAAADYAGGSMEATARLLCMKAATQDRLRQLDKKAPTPSP